MPEDEGHRVTEPKRVKVAGCRDDWTGFVVTVDGKELEVYSVSMNVTVDEPNTVTLVLPAATVELDIRTPSEDTYFVRSQATA